jgi:HSP20 family protein
MLDFWDEIAALERRLDDVVREFLGGRTRLATPALPLFVSKPFVPVTDVFDRDGDLVIRLEIPGIDPEKDLTIGVREGVLTVKGERKQREEVKEDRYYRMEASYGAFERSFPIPKGIGDDAVDATYEDGVLEVVVRGAAKKAEEPAETKPIPVKVAAPKRAA